MVLGIVIFNITVLLRVLTMNSSCSGMGLAYKTCFSYCCSVAKSCPTLCKPMKCSMPGPVLHYLLIICSNSYPLSQWCYLAISSSATRFFCLQSPSIRVFSSESVRIRWSKYWSFSFSISLSSEYSRLISSRINWFDFLVFQGTLKSLL